jgi:deazaflavin-dependent oxidoreductase (nitroreductase family)
VIVGAAFGDETRPMVSLHGGPSTAIQRGLRWLAATRAGAWLFARVLHRIDRVAFRLSGGRGTVTSALSGLPVVMLTTIGARTGLLRTVPVLGFPINGETAVAAGNFGRPQEPAWAVNLRRHPRAEITTGGRRQPVVAEELTDGAREGVWRRAIEIYPGAAAYQRRARGRTIGVFLLHADDRRPGDGQC